MFPHAEVNRLVVPYNVIQEDGNEVLRMSLLKRGNIPFKVSLKTSLAGFQ